MQGWGEVSHAGWVGHECSKGGVGWDGSCRGGVRWVMQGWGGVGHAYYFKFVSL